MLGETAETVEEWIELYRTQRKIAEMLVRDPTVYVQAWSHAGFSIECLIKAAIMSQQRLNRWPSRKERKDLYVHTIQELLALLGIKLILLIQLPRHGLSCSGGRGRIHMLLRCQE